MRQAPITRVIHLKVRELAEAKGLSDLELAHLASVDARVIRKMWTGQRVGEVLLHQLMRVADALEVDVCELIETERQP
jgi:transcriptional regulator with XRE-family HTH domain